MTAQPQGLPAPLLSAERERVIARLQDAVAADQLDLDELDARLEAAIRARTPSELALVTADLPALAAPPMASPAALPALPSVGGRIAAVFASATRRGRRAMPRELQAKAVFGSVVIDLREATFEAGVSTITCKAVFGSVEIYAPPHVRVEVDGSGVFGSFEERGDNSAAHDLPDAPVLVVKGKAVFGSVEAFAGSAFASLRRASAKKPHRGAR
jgi:hypothetical protein